MFCFSWDGLDADWEVYKRDCSIVSDLVGVLRKRGIIRDGDLRSVARKYGVSYSVVSDYRGLMYEASKNFGRDRVGDFRLVVGPNPLEVCLLAFSLRERNGGFKRRGKGWH